MTRTPPGWGGARIATVAFPVLALTSLQAGPFQVALLLALGYLAMPLCWFPATALARRVGRRSIMIACDAASLLLMLTVPLVGMTGRLSLGHLYAIVSLTGVLTVFHRAAGESRSAGAAVELVAPAIGGALVDLLGATRTMFASALAYGLGALALIRIRAKPPAAEPIPEPIPEPVTFRAAVAEGLGFVRRQALLRMLLICTAASTFWLAAVFAIAVTFLLYDLNAYATVIGLVLAFASLAGALAGLLAGPIRVLPSVVLLMPLARPGWGIVLFAVGLAAASAATVLIGATAASARRRSCPPELLATVTAAHRWVDHAVLPFGALLGGALAALLGLRPALLVCALGLWAASGVVALLIDGPDRASSDIS